MIGAVEVSDDAVRAAVEGSQAERSRLLTALAPRVRLMVAARLSPTPGHFDAVDEITQQVLIALDSGLARLKNPTADGLRAYASGIVTRQVIQHIRQRAAGQPGRAPVASLDTTVSTLSDGGALWRFLSASGTSPSSAFERAEQVARLMTELGQLKTEYREVITLAFFDQLPVAEIAKQRGTSQRATSMLLLRAVRTLRRNMTSFSRTQ